jgi:nucleoside-diphosphate-sugar epimerase
MILITGGTSFNASDFMNTTSEKIIVVLNKTEPTIIRDNIVYFKNIIDFKNSSLSKEVKVIINFASSYNTSRRISSHFRSSFIFLFRLFHITKKNNLILIINIGSYFQDIVKEKYSGYTFTKNFTDFVFSHITKKTKYVNLKIGDTYGPNDPRNKIFKYLKKSKDNSETVFSGNPDDIFYLVAISDISNALNYMIKNRKLFLKSNIQYIRLFGEAVTLEQLIYLYKDSLSLKFSFLFNGQKVTRPGFKNLKSDYDFILNEQNIKDI